ncbi:hypothetical protein K4K59_012829 [Colletotrichum sp. SAR11_240]|nr:hypothetical protein K4K59_012829 [Colletotrichum sp. SAR11_240]
MASPCDLSQATAPTLPAASPQSAAAQDADSKPAMSTYKQHKKARKDQYLAERSVQKQHRKREHRRELHGMRAVLPTKAFKPIRGDAKLGKIVGSLLYTLNTEFKHGFSFSLTDKTYYIDTDIAENFCVTLSLQGFPNRDAAKIMGFMQTLLRACENLIHLHDSESGDDNAGFFEAVMQVVRERGVKGGGLTPKNDSMQSLVTATGKVMLQKFAMARQAFLREMAEKNEEEGSYTAKFEDLLSRIDVWISFACEPEHEKMENAATGGLVGNGF